MLAGGGQVGADRGERVGAVEGAHAPGDLLLGLDHADLLLGGVVRRWDGRVGGEPQVVLEPAGEPSAQRRVLLAELSWRVGVVAGGQGQGAGDQRPVGGGAGRVRR